jgi:hypothetical protein
MTLWGQFRDINEYKTAFAESRPQSHPENRPWLEAHLDSSSRTFYPSSEPTESLFHWIEGFTVSQVEAVCRQGEKTGDPLGENEKGSPYVSEFRHSMSLDFGTLDFDTL